MLKLINIKILLSILDALLAIGGRPMTPITTLASSTLPGSEAVC